MADSTLSAMIGAAALTGTELFYAIQSAADRKVTAAQLKTFAWLGDQIVTGQFTVTATGLPGPPDGSAWITLAAPNTKAFLLSTLDHLGNVTRTFAQADGRVDFYANGAAGQVAGPPLALNFNAVTPANGDNLGHYAYRGKDSNGNWNTFAYLYGKAEKVSAAGLSSSILINVMRNLPAGGGNAQPNWGILINGDTGVITYPSDATFSEGGNRTVTSAVGPLQTYVNSANSRNLIVGLSDNLNGTINATGTAALLLQSSNVTGVQIASTLVTMPLPTLLQRELRSSKTTNYAVQLTDAGTQFDNAGAAGQVDFTLPTSPPLGTRYGFCVRAAQTLRVIAGTSNFIMVGGTQSASAGNASSAQNGAYIEIEATASNLWTAKSVTGTGGSTGAGGWTVT